MMQTLQAHELFAGSFRDPSGLLFRRDGRLFRQINATYKDDYEHLLRSGLYDALVGEGLLISHKEVGREEAVSEIAYTVIQPEPIPFISYPYEWCFSQLKDAALITLRIERVALEHGMTLKDASAYNIQFRRGKPLLIDTLSFERYHDGQVWGGYRQFCQQFLAPLALMSCCDVRLNQLLRVYVDGIPLDLASRLLPLSTRLRIPLLCHLHLHARSERRLAGALKRDHHRISRLSFVALIDHLEGAVRDLRWHPERRGWVRYYEEMTYASEAFEEKQRVVAAWLKQLRPASVWDLGANTGVFSRLAGGLGIPTIAFDLDPAAVEQHYCACIDRKEALILPLVLDLTNPSPGLGWEHEERLSLLARGPADTVLTLALIHHLAIANNLPLHRIAGGLHRMGRSLIIEFVPKNDSQVQRLMASRADIFPTYTREEFERVFGELFAIRSVAPITSSDRTLYLMERRLP